ncbi:MAG: hypothetical protein ABSD46_11740 [Bacteroidota bacterium]
MELEDLKNMWKEQNRILEKGIALSEQVLKNVFKQKANGEIEKLLEWEYFSLIEYIVFLIFISISTYKFMDDWRFLISGIFSMVFYALCTILSISEIKQLYNIDLFSKSIIDTQQAILKRRKQEKQIIKVFLFIIPLIIPSLILLGHRLVHNVNLLDHPHFFTILSVGSIVVTYPVVFIAYQRICLRRYRIIENNLLELEKFKEE